MNGSVHDSIVLGPDGAVPELEKAIKELELFDESESGPDTWESGPEVSTIAWLAMEIYRTDSVLEPFLSMFRQALFGHSCHEFTCTYNIYIYIYIYSSIKICAHV